LVPKASLTCEAISASRTGTTRPNPCARASGPGDDRIDRQAQAVLLEADVDAPSRAFTCPIAGPGWPSPPSRP
jgi:hypothetical protein